MVNYFQLIAERMADTGLFNFLFPWMITAAIFWGVLKKSGLFESSAVNAIIAISFSFLIWGVFVGSTTVDLAGPLSRFALQTSVIIFVLIIGIVISSIFYPNITEIMKSQFKDSGIIWIMIVGVGILFILSGLWKVLIIDISAKTEGARNIVWIALIFAMFIIIMFVLASGKKPVG